MTLTVRDITQISLMAALTFISGFIMIPMGPVPFTLQTLLVLVTGLLLKPRAALLTQVLHLLLKLLLGGGQSILSPSFGFLFGFIAAAWAMSILLLKWENSFVSYMKATIIGTVLIYLIGMPYMAVILNGYLGAGYTITQVFWMGMGLFIPGDLLKAGLAVLIAVRVKKHVRLFN
ncbi:biotin transporter BioY [Desemzia sp. RIT 804]|uniref:biotin transporter BioY n=1 Tax=Desemzia sp. RIT 804 TaxID=2810209 RepID=UPI001F1635B3|nr:ECF transporter S component [Desemzia sp. RIT 804]